MARPELDRVGQAGQLDPAADGLRKVVFGRDAGPLEPGPTPCTPRRSAAGRTARGSAGLGGCARSESAIRASVSGSRDLLETDSRALDEAGDEVALRPDERRHLRPDADTSSRDGRRVLDFSADAEQMGVIAGETDNVAVGLTADRDQEIAVGDATRQRVRERELAPGQFRHALESAATSSSRSSPRRTPSQSPDRAGRRSPRPALDEIAARRSLAAPHRPPPRDVRLSDHGLAGHRDRPLRHRRPCRGWRSRSRSLRRRATDPTSNSYSGQGGKASSSLPAPTFRTVH